jgi:hypothetical protein
MPRLDLSQQVRNLSEMPVCTNGAFADIWTGMIGGKKVAIKRMRHSMASDFEKMEKVGVSL